MKNVLFLLVAALSSSVWLQCEQGGNSLRTGAKTTGQNITASFDSTGQHPGTAAIGGPVKITCTRAVSDIPNPQPRPSCLIQAPGYGGNLNPGQSAGASGAGTVVLNCNGQGNVLRCGARIN
jgi:hypothetical protein